MYSIRAYFLQSVGVMLRTDDDGHRMPEVGHWTQDRRHNG